MALTTIDYEELKALGEAQFGSPFKDTEENFFQSLINLAARRAERSTPFWERLLVVGEARSIDDCGNVQLSEDSYNVECAGTEEVNGLYVRNGTDPDAGRPAYTLFSDDGEEQFNMWYYAGGWIITSTQIGSPPPPLTSDSYYSSPTNSELPPNDWQTPELFQGVAPAPSVVATSDMDIILDMHLYYPPWTGQGGTRVQYDVSSNGAYVQQGSGGTESVAYVTYKKKLTDRYGDGSGGTVSDIPEEWANYMSLYAARQLQIGNRQGNSSPYAVIASREVEDALEDEKMKIEQQNIVESVARRMTTPISQNRTLY